MHISKIVLNFALLMGLAFVATTATASSVCNMRDGKSRFAASNPDKATAHVQQKRQSQGPQKRYSKKHKGSK